jgi:hypothetical protein
MRCESSDIAGLHSREKRAPPTAAPKTVAPSSSRPVGARWGQRALESAARPEQNETAEGVLIGLRRRVLGCPAPTVAIVRNRALPAGRWVGHGGAQARFDRYGVEDVRGCVRGRRWDIRPRGGCRPSGGDSRSDGSAGLADVVSGHALAIHHDHTDATAFTDLRDRRMRRLDGRNWHGLCRRCEGQSQGDGGQSDHCTSPIFCEYGPPSTPNPPRRKPRFRWTTAGHAAPTIQREQQFLRWSITTPGSVR